MKTKKYGYWRSNGIDFLNKIDALRYATQNNDDLVYMYHDEVWNKFDRSLLGKISLNQLYKERAQQLRDRYDYLILYYSGGSDSHNVLMTYINNGIKLDEIIVRWPEALRGGKLYTPNTTDKSSSNIWSEWDYAITPSLDWLKLNHPEIKITIKDYIEDLNETNLESRLETSNHTRAGFLLSFAKEDLNYSKKSIGHIFGADKPVLAVQDQKIYMIFNDIATSMLYSDKTKDSDPESIECFYWAPDFPLLTFEMAYQVSEYFNVNKDKRKFLLSYENNKLMSDNFNFQRSITYQIQNNLVKNICYDTWDFKFQAEKITSANAEDKWWWFFQKPEFTNLKQQYISLAKSITNQIDKKFLLGYNSSFQTTKTTSSNLFYIRTLDP
jgi:hypothetical protein